MGPVLRVNVESLRAAAHVERQVGDEVSRTDAGAALAAAAAGMAGLPSGRACQFAGASFDEAVARATEALSAHSESLLSAGKIYEGVDGSFGQRLSQTTGLK